MLRYNCYNDQTILKDWKGQLFNDISDAIQIMLSNNNEHRRTVINIPVNNTNNLLLDHDPSILTDKDGPSVSIINDDNISTFPIDNMTKINNNENCLQKSK